MAGRIPVLGYAGQTFPVAGLFGVELAAPFPAGARVRLGPLFALDGMLLAASERHCKQGYGCRHRIWAGSDTGVGASLAPAGGVFLSSEGSRGGRFEASLAVQPTIIYDMFWVFAPRLDLSWTTPRALQSGLHANRFGVGVELGYRFAGS